MRSFRVAASGFALVGASVALSSHEVRAQAATAAAPPGAIWVRVVDPSQTPMAGAEVVLPMLGVTLKVPDGGALLLTGVPAGAYLLQARQIGFAPAWQTLRVGRDTAVTQLALGALGQQLDTVNVRAEAGLPGRLGDFARRKERNAFGKFITRQDIERRKPVDVAAMLRPVQGVQVATSGGVTSITSRRAVGASGCSSMLVFLDGALVLGRPGITGGPRFQSASASPLNGARAGGYSPSTVGVASSGTDPVRGSPANGSGSTGSGTSGSGTSGTGTTTPTPPAAPRPTGGGFAFSRQATEPDWNAVAMRRSPTSAFDVNSVPTSLIVGVEVYTSTAGIPPEYAGFAGAECGVILMWTAAA